MTDNQTLSVVLDALRDESRLITANVPELRAEGHTAYADAWEIAADALDRVATRIESAMASAGPDPEPYVGFSGARYGVQETSRASLDDGPLMFEPRLDKFGPTEDER